MGRKGGQNHEIYSPEYVIHEQTYSKESESYYKHVQWAQQRPSSPSEKKNDIL